MKARVFCPQQRRGSREAGFSRSVMEHTGRHVSRRAQSACGRQSRDSALLWAEGPNKP